MSKRKSATDPDDRVDLVDGRNLGDEELRRENERITTRLGEIDRERRKYYEFFEFAPDACIVTDEHCTIREANTAASQLLGVTRQLLVGKPLTTFFDGAARANHRHQLDQLCGLERIDDWEISVQPRGGYPVPASVSIGRLSASALGNSGFRWIIRDITRRQTAEREVRKLNRELELRVASRTSQLASSNRTKEELLESEHRAREQAEIANRVKSDFLALLSHEFRTPLQAIFGYTELLEREIHGPLNELQQRDLKRIQHSQQHLLGLINSILEYAKLDSGQPLDITCYPTVMNETLASVEALVGPHLEAKSLRYEYKCADPSVIAQADPAKVQQIVLNLVANAIKFTDTGGKISVECSLDGGDVAVHVTDTGRGIPADKLDACFEPFVQIRPGGTPFSGTGLGLPISRHLAIAMKGSLSATSELGKGSTFTLRLPRSISPASRRSPTSS
ncbi:MAG: PAS domain-containing sensor histidine kinase [Gemmatimonadaceae bacterium]